MPLAVFMLRSLRQLRNTAYTARAMSSTVRAGAVGGVAAVEDSAGTPGTTSSTAGAGPTRASGEQAAEDTAPPKPTGLVMQIIVRRDLMTSLGWPVGPLMAQAAHAASAVQHVHAAHPDMARYLSGDDGRAWQGMRKALLEVADEEALRGLADALEAAGVPHHLWIEEP